MAKPKETFNKKEKEKATQAKAGKTGKDGRAQSPV